MSKFSDFINFIVLLKYFNKNDVFLRYFPYATSGNFDSDIVELMAHINNDTISRVFLYTKPLDEAQWINLMFYHAYVVFYTETRNGKFWWSLEKNGEALILQMSRFTEDVRDKNEGEKRIKKTGYWRPDLNVKDNCAIRFRELYDYIIVDTDQLNIKYNYSDENCKKFAKIVFDKIAQLLELCCLIY